MAPRPSCCGLILSARGGQGKHHALQVNGGFPKRGQFTFRHRPVYPGDPYKRPPRLHSLRIDSSYGTALVKSKIKR
jgi:hypothetical protein